MCFIQFRNKMENNYFSILYIIYVLYIMFIYKKKWILYTETIFKTTYIIIIISKSTNQHRTMLLKRRYKGFWKFARKI